MLKSLKLVFILLCFAVIYFISPLISSAGEHNAQFNVVFLSPGNEDDSFWGLVVDFMQAAADDLVIDLEIIYCDRAHYLIKKEGLEIINRLDKPDYLILVNELNSAVELIKEADRAGIKTLLFNEIFIGEDSVTMGIPRQNYKNWLLELRPDDYQAGYLLTKKLVEICRKNKPDQEEFYIAGITGPEDNSSSILRVNGLQDFVAQNQGLKLLQVTSADYDEKKAAQISYGLLKRYPNLDIIWTASDRMALGVEQTLKENNVEVLTGGVDWDLGAINSLSESGIDVSVGGHFMDGAWLLVMLYDYHNGIEFESLKLKSNFTALTQKNIQLYLDNFGDNDWTKIDFTKYSKTLNKDMKGYNFQLDELKIE